SFAVAASTTSPVAGTAFDLTVTAKDAYGNVASGYAGTVTFTSTDTQASRPADYAFSSTAARGHKFLGGVTLKTAGTQSLTPPGPKSGIKAAPAAASALALTGAPAGVTAGSAFSVTVMAQDAYGNRVTGYTGTVHFTSSDSQAGLPADYTFTSSDSGDKVFSV